MVAPAPAFVGMLAIAWPVGWAIYGAVGGLLSPDTDGGAPARAAVLYAAIGCWAALALRWLATAIG
ncbi:MAG: hypothetical protein U0470_13995 [Anaerolineae bacterium]